MTNLDYLYNPNIAKTYREKNYLVDEKLGFQIIEQGTILSHKGANAKNLPFGGLGADVLGGIVDSKGNSVENTFVADTINKPYTPPVNQLYTAPKLSFTLVSFIPYGDT